MKPVFIHVPKTGGSSVLRLPWVDYAGHATYGEAVEQFGVERLYFSVIRHPVDRWVSCMAVVWQNIGNYPADIRQYVGGFGEFLEGLARDLALKDFTGCSGIQKVLFRGMAEQLRGGKVFPVHFKTLHFGLGTVAYKTGAKFNKLELQHLGKTEIEKPKLSEGAFKAVAEYYKEDMERYGYK